MAKQGDFVGTLLSSRQPTYVQLPSERYTKEIENRTAHKERKHQLRNAQLRVA